jgi:uncharacterized membrane protein
VAVFLGSHSLTNLPAIRRPAERLLGRAGYTIAYSLLSLALLAWMIAAYVAAPTLLLWGQEPWMRWVPPIAMLAACQLWAAGMSTPNPFSIGPGGRGFDPARPGILRLTRHPVLWGLAIWAGAHVVPNGDAAALLLFVPLLVLALAGPAMLERKRRRSLGAEFDRLAALTGKPSAAMLAEIGWKRLLAGLVLYAALLHLHAPVIGASPLP